MCFSSYWWRSQSLKNYFREVRQSTTSWEGACFSACTYISIGTTVDLGTTGLNTVDLGTTTLNTFNLATTTLITVDLDTASNGARATVNLGIVQGENDYSFFGGNSLIETTIATNTITSYGIEEGAEFISGAVMGATEASHDGDVDATLLNQMKTILLL